MAKDTNIEDVDLELEIELPEPKGKAAEPVNDDEADSEPKKPLSVREAINAALKEQEDKADSEEPSEPKTAPAPKKASKELQESEDTDSVSEAPKKAPKESKPAEPKDDLKAPVSWDKPAKEAWNTLPAPVRQAINKRETEVSNGFAQYGEKTKNYEALERVIAPRRQQIQQFGATEAETVDRLFQWMEALSGPNKVQAFQQLGQSFGIAAPTQQQTREPEPENDESQIPPKLRELLTNVVQKVSTFEQTQQQQEQAAAKNYVDTWAADKPHFQKVGRVMHSLITSGAIPTENGKTTTRVLDAAYNMAIYADPEIRAELDQKRAAETAEKEAKANAEAERKRKEQLAKARRAATSIKPQAPAPQLSTPVGRKPNGKYQSPRDSIRAAIAEVNES